MRVLKNRAVVCPRGFASRAMLESDLPRVLEIEREAHFTPWGEQAFLDAMTTGDELPVILANKEIVGYGVLKVLWREAELLNLAVAKPWRQRGLGRFLVALLLQSALYHGAPQVFLEVRESNIKAQTLYQQMGFEIIGARKAYYACPEGGREDARLMCWTEKRNRYAA